MKDPKFVVFRGIEPQCFNCKTLMDYRGCEDHVESYPMLTKKRGVKIPLCPECSISCSNCGLEYRIDEFLKVHKDFGATTPKTKKRKKKKTDIKVAEPVSALIKNIDTSGSKLLSFYRESTRSILDTMFSFDLGTQLGIEDIAKKLDDKIPLNVDHIRTSLNKISSLLALLMLIRLSGLSSYEDAIMKSEIIRLYGGTKPGKPRDVDTILAAIKEALKQ